MTQVSVLMTVYNGIDYLSTAVESIRRQTLQDFKLVIVNDGSTDGTAEYLNGLQDDRLQVVHQDNAGTANAANHGLEFCDTEWVARMDSDDISLPNRLQVQCEFLGNHPEVGLLGAQMVPIGDDRSGPSLCLPTTHKDVFEGLLAGRHAMAHSCVMARTEVLKSVGGYRHFKGEGSWLNDAWDMMLRMGEAAELANTENVLHQYRIHSGSLNGATMRRMRYSIAYACELSRLRQAGQPEISYPDFLEALQNRPLLTRLAETLELHARRQYRLAQGEIYGSRRWQGRARMAWAALCSPQLASERVVRSVRHRFGKLHSTPL